MESFLSPLPVTVFEGAVNGQVERLRKSRRFSRRQNPDGLLYRSSIVRPVPRHEQISHPHIFSAGSISAFPCPTEKFRIVPASELCPKHEDGTHFGAVRRMPDVASFMEMIDEYSEKQAFLRQLAGNGSFSPTYAGARFSDAPSPKVLPPPPRHWVSCRQQPPVCHEMTNYLKTVLRVK